jgi:copper resistance protein B
MMTTYIQNSFRKNIFISLVVTALFSIGSLHAEEDHSMHDMSSSNTNTMVEKSGARSPHEYADGLSLDSGPFIPAGVSRLKLADEHKFFKVAFDRLEAVDADSGNHAVYDMSAWYGNSYDKLVFKAEGEIEHGSLVESETELVISHAINPFWDLQAGVRHDDGDEASRNWLSVGLAGLTPYWFEVDGALYVGESGRSMLQVEVEYDLLLTQRLILQPRIEVTAFGKSDDEISVGSGLSSALFGMRLRYELNRQFAPYVGIEWTSKYGRTADLTREEGGDKSDTRLVAGVRFWY